MSSTTLLNTPSDDDSDDDPSSWPEEKSPSSPPARRPSFIPPRRYILLALCSLLAIGSLSIANPFLFEPPSNNPSPQTSSPGGISTDIAAPRAMFEIDTTDVNYQVAYSYVLTLWGVILIFAVYYQATRLSLYYSRKDMLRLAAAAAKSFAVHETSLSSPAGLVVPKVLTAPKRSFEARRPTVSPRSPFRGWLQRSPNASAGAANQHRITDTALDASHLLLPPDPTAYFSARVFVYQVMNYSFRVSTVSDIVTVHQAILLLLYLWTNLIFIIASPFTSATTSTSLPSSSEFADRAAYLGLANFAFMVPFATRNSVFLRLVGVPFEKMITYHRWFGRTGFLLLTYHACWHVTQNYLVLQDSFKAMFGTFQFGYGACTYISLLFLAFFSHEFFRRRYFEIFYITHFLGFYFFILFGSNHNDAFLPFMSIGIFLWLVDRCVRFYRSWIEPMRVVEIKPVQGEVTRIIFEKGAPGSSGENRAGQSGQLVGFVRGMFGGWGWRFKPGQYVFVSIGGEALSRGQGGWIKWMGWMRWHPATVSGFANPVLGGAYGEEDDDDVDTNYEQFQLAQDQLLTENAMPMQGLSPPLPPPGMFGGMGYHGFAYTPQNVVHEELEMQDIHPTYHPCANGITSPDPYVPPDETSQTIQHQHSPYHHHQYQNSQSSVHTRPVSFATVAGSPHHQQQNSSSSTHMPSNSLAKNRRPSVPLRLGRSQTTRSAYSTHPSATSGFFASVHIKALGNHTRALYDTLSTLSASSGIEDNEKYLTQSNALAARVPVRVDGPYGLPTVEFQDHKVAVLMACGIGITPMMALARDLVVRRTEGVETVRTEEVWVIWSVPDQDQYGTFATDLTYLSSLSTTSHQSLYPCTLNVRIHTTQSTPMNANVALMNKHNHSFIPGRPNIKKTMRAIKDASPMEDVGVCVCGPPEFVRKVRNTAVWTCSDAGGVWWVQEEKFVL